MIDDNDVAFLRAYLEETPDFQGVVQLDPPRALWEGRWLELRGVRTVQGGVLLELKTGKRLRLSSTNRPATVRTVFRKSLLELLRSRFRGYRFEKVLAGTDRVRGQPASILRALLVRGTKRIAALAAYPGSPDCFDRVFSSLAVWWDQLARSGPRVEAFLMIPEEWGERLVHCFPLLDIPLVCCKYALPGDGSAKPALRQIYPAPAEATRVGSPYVLLPLPDEVPAILADISRRNPDLDLTLRRGFWELSFRGLPLAWQQHAGARCLFDRLHPKELSEGWTSRFELHLNAVRRFRRFPSPDSGHPYYHLKPERWLESLLLRNGRLIDADFVGNVYSQVPTCIDGERRVLDLLTVTRKRRLAVVELKVEKDLGLIFQALDYWERVDSHRRRGDFQRAGYFCDVELSHQSPLLYLVSPLFEFHRVMPVLRARLRREVRFRCVGVNSDWRRELKVLRRFEF